MLLDALGRAPIVTDESSAIEALVLQPKLVAADATNLKVTWPFRDNSKPRFGKYYFVGEEYDIDRIDYAGLGADVPVYDSIYLSLASSFRLKDELDRAHTKIDTLIKGFCHEYGRIHR